MRPALFACLLLSAAGLAAAAPVPEEKGIIKGFGRWVDPDKDCEWRLENGKLAVTLPGKDHDLGIERNRMNAPRVLREVTGDFTAELRVGGDFEPVEDAAALSPTGELERVAFQGAGLLLMADEKTYIRLERAALRYKDQGDAGRHRYTNWELRDNADWKLSGTIKTFPLENKETYLRLERKGNKVKGWVSQDAKDWNELPELEVVLPEKVLVGIGVVTTSRKVFRPQFDQFKVETLKKDDSKEKKE
jgi:regulation of enolase protein 1 (concanavalin A-like superfamily)